MIWNHGVRRGVLWVCTFCANLVYESDMHVIEDYLMQSKFFGLKKPSPFLI